VGCQSLSTVVFVSDHQNGVVTGNGPEQSVDLGSVKCRRDDVR
jgi:hypothetical protein